MDSPSSTSSSSHALPMAGLLAVLMIGLLEFFVLGPSGPWDAVRTRLEALPPRDARLELGIANDRLELRRLSRAPPAAAKVIVMGNSRAQVGLRFHDIEEASLSGLVVAKLTHAPISPWIMRSFVPEAIASDPDLVVLLFSEMDTHRPIIPVPAATYGGSSATVLAAAMGPAGAWSARTDLERLFVSDWLKAYRYRTVFGRAWLDDVRSFDLDPQRFPSAPPRYSEPSDELPDVEDLDAIQASIRLEVGREVKNHTLRLVHDIRPGVHVAAQERLLEGTVAELCAAGIRVLLVEGPLNPAGYPLYDHETTRGESRAFAERLALVDRVRFLPLERTGPFRAEDFSDLLHLRPAAARRLTAAVLAEIRGFLPESAGR